MLVSDNFMTREFYGSSDYSSRLRVLSATIAGPESLVFISLTDTINLARYKFTKIALL